MSYRGDSITETNILFFFNMGNHTAVVYMADGQPSPLGSGRHPSSETSVGLPGEQKLYVRRTHMRSWPHSDEVQTFRGETEQRRYCENAGSSCALAERRCRHDMMMLGNHLE